MSRIPPVEFEDADEPIRKEFEDQIKKNGRITNMKRTLLHSLPAFHALMEWFPLRDELLKFIGEREFDIFAYAISKENQCLVCSTFFRKILIDSGDDPDALNLSDKEKALIDYGGQCVNGAHSIGDDLYRRLKSFFSDAQIVALTAFAGLMIATNLVNNALQVDLDEYLISYAKR
jgi:alkylhydroperoxidase family enzyme